MDFIRELKWRGLYFDMIPDTDKHLRENISSGYIGFDPTSSSLGIGNLVQIMILRFFQNCGHRPVALLGGATGMIGDPSGKSAERNLLSREQLLYNKERVKAQLARYFDFGNSAAAPLLLDNYDWFKNITLLDFLRDVGKHLTVSYMIAKDSVKSRMETGISYTEFSYQLIQAYDFYWMNKQYGITMQMGGSDQWGNITAGVELIRRMGGTSAFAVTSPLITKSDGGKFGKTEEGNIYLDPEMTSPYKFYQFWFNVSDEDAERYLKIFTFLPQEEILALVAEHKQAAHLRNLQKRLAKEVTVMVHGERDYNTALHASEIIFGQSTKDQIFSISERDFRGIAQSMPTFKVGKALFENGGVDVLRVLAADAAVFPSKSEMRRLIKEGGLSVNKEKISDEGAKLTTSDLIQNRYLLVQKGKKNFYLLIAE